MPATALRIALIQCNPTLGDFAGNALMLGDFAAQAAAEGAQLALTPELALNGYPPEDWLLRADFLAASAEAFAALLQRSRAWPDLHLLVGHAVAQPSATQPSTPNPIAANCASLIKNGALLGRYHKRELPNYGVFDERRHFVPGNSAFVFDLLGRRFGVNICEDAWLSAAPQAAAKAGAQTLLVLNASPFHAGKVQERTAALARAARSQRLSLIATQAVGAQDEIIFDGGSFALNAQGEIVMRASAFVPGVFFIDQQSDGTLRGAIAPEMEPEEQIWLALTIGLRDFIDKNRIRGVLLGLSGGVDSALVATLAADALGAERVRAYMLPSRFTAAMSRADSALLAQRLGIGFDEISIEPGFEALRATLAPHWASGTASSNLAEENLQARLRGILLMALANQSGDLLLSCGNKSELATGYCTLYGDMAGGFAPIKDVSKTLVYRLAHWRNARAQSAPPFDRLRANGGGAQGGGELIPQRILTRAPSAELRENQTDQDSLPPYDALDEVLRRYIEQRQSAEEIIAAGSAPEIVRRTLALIHGSEFKRRQAPPGPRITPTAFGRDWRLPITSRFSLPRSS